jgi:hypothetical protein
MSLMMGQARTEEYFFYCKDCMVHTNFKVISTSKDQEILQCEDGHQKIKSKLKEPQNVTETASE